MTDKGTPWTVYTLGELTDKVIRAKGRRWNGQSIMSYISRSNANRSLPVFSEHKGRQMPNHPPRKKLRVINKYQLYFTLIFWFIFLVWMIFLVQLFCTSLLSMSALFYIIQILPNLTNKSCQYCQYAHWLSNIFTMVCLTSLLQRFLVQILSWSIGALFSTEIGSRILISRVCEKTHPHSWTEIKLA